MFYLELFEEIETVETVHVKLFSELLSEGLSSYEAIENELGLPIEKGNKQVLELLVKLKKEEPEVFTEYYVVKYPLTFQDILEDLQISHADFDAAYDEEEEENKID